MSKKALQKAKDSLLDHTRTVPITRPAAMEVLKKGEEHPASADSYFPKHEASQPPPPTLDWRSKILQARQKPQETSIPTIPVPQPSSEISSPSSLDEDRFWLPQDAYDGQLAVDVIQTPEAIILQSAMAGVRPEDLQISMTNDMITIRGTRQRTLDVPSEHYLYEECYCGGFSRSIILPFPVQNEHATATLDHGILTVFLPKSPQQHGATIPVTEVPETPIS